MKKSVERPANKPKISGGAFKKYYRPTVLNQAVEILSVEGENLKVLAGGTDILVDYYDRLHQIRGWLDLQGIPELKEIKLSPDRIEIGPMVTHQRLEKSETIKRFFPLLAQAAADIGSPQIRNRGTIGGNIVTASPAGDLLPPLIVYNARFELFSGNQISLIPAVKFFAGPKQTILKSDQLLSRIVVPVPEKDTAGSWQKIGKRKALVIASISLALLIRISKQGLIKDLRACFGAVAPTPLLLEGLRELTVDKEAGSLDYQQIEGQVFAGIAPITDLRGSEGYRRRVASKVMIKALKEIVEQGVSKCEDHN